VKKLILKHFESNKVVLECDITDLTIEIVDLEEKHELKLVEPLWYGIYIGIMCEQLTKGKIYKIKNFEYNNFILIDDYGNGYIASSTRFYITSESEYLNQEENKNKFGKR